MPAKVVHPPEPVVAAVPEPAAEVTKTATGKIVVTKKQQSAAFLKRFADDESKVSKSSRVDREERMAETVAIQEDKNATAAKGLANEEESEDEDEVDRDEESSDSDDDDSEEDVINDLTKEVEEETALRRAKRKSASEAPAKKTTKPKRKAAAAEAEGEENGTATEEASAAPEKVTIPVEHYEEIPVDGIETDKGEPAFLQKAVGTDGHVYWAAVDLYNILPKCSLRGAVSAIKQKLQAPFISKKGDRRPLSVVAHKFLLHHLREDAKKGSISDELKLNLQKVIKLVETHDSIEKHDQFTVTQEQIKNRDEVRKQLQRKKKGNKDQQPPQPAEEEQKKPKKSKREEESDTEEPPKKKKQKKAGKRQQDTDEADLEVLDKEILAVTEGNKEHYLDDLIADAESLLEELTGALTTVHARIRTLYKRKLAKK